MARERYRGLRLHEDQSPARLLVVKADIDAVMDMVDVHDLLEAAKDVRRAPEARLLAAARIEAGSSIARGERRTAELELVELARAAVAGLADRTWWHKYRFASDLDVDSELAPLRAKPLA